MHPDSAKGFIGKFFKRYGIRGVANSVTHRFRHTFISRAITSGADIASVAALVGDRVETILRYYTHADEDAIKAAAEVYRKGLE